MKQTIKNIFFLGVKELRGLSRDWMLLALIAYAFTIGVYVSGNAAGDTISKAAIAVVDEDNSQASKRICDAFFPPMFLPAETITLNEIDPAMDVLSMGMSHDYTVAIEEGATLIRVGTAIFGPRQIVGGISING